MMSLRKKSELWNKKTRNQIKGKSDTKKILRSEFDS